MYISKLRTWRVTVFTYFSRFTKDDVRFGRMDRDVTNMIF